MDVYDFMCPECHALPHEHCVYIAHQGTIRDNIVGQPTRKPHNGRRNRQWAYEQYQVTRHAMNQLRTWLQEYGDTFEEK